MYPGDAAVDDADDHVDAGGCKAYGQGDPGAEHDPHEDIPAELVGAEPVLEGGQLVESAAVHAVIGVGGEDGDKDGHQAHENDEAQADEGQLVAPEVAPGVLQEGLGLHCDELGVLFRGRQRLKGVGRQRMGGGGLLDDFLHVSHLLTCPV